MDENKIAKEWAEKTFGSLVNGITELFLFFLGVLFIPILLFGYVAIKLKKLWRWGGNSSQH